MSEVEVGHVVHYFGKISVAAVEITAGTVSVGNILHFKGETTDFRSEVVSMQVENAPVQEAKAGDSIGLKVPEKVRKGDKVYKVVED